MRFTGHLVFCLVGAAALFGCGDPPLANITSKDGNSVDPGGVIQGSVTYSGPRPLCKYVGGKPTEMIGAGAVLVLYGFKDPLPPDGPLPASVLYVPMNQFFGDLRDCLPENPTPADLHLTVSRTAEYTWPRIPLGSGLSSRSYRIEGIFDRDGDYYPLLPLTHAIHTAGDAIGGAYIGFSRNPYEIKFDGVCSHKVAGTDREDGQVIKGVGVTLALSLWTERPMFEVVQNNKRKYLSSEQFIDLGTGEWGDSIPPPSFNPKGQDASREAAYARLQKFSGLELRMIDNKRAAPTCKNPATLAEDGSNQCVGPTLAKLKLGYDLLDQKSYAWHLWPRDASGDGVVDLTPRDADNNGSIGPEDIGDFNPFLSNAFGPPVELDSTADGFAFSHASNWTLPLVFLSRIQSDEEKLAKIPAVGLAGGADYYTQQKHSVYFPTLPVTVPPVATITTAPADANGDGKIDYDPNGDNQSDCSVDIYPAGNLALTYNASGRVSDCQELPPADYSTVAITGIAGNVVYTKDARSETGWNLALPDDDHDGKADPFAVAGVGQLWLHPNDLGNPKLFADAFLNVSDNEEERIKLAKSLAIASQGRDQAFKIRDPFPKNAVRPAIADDQQVVDPDTDGTRRIYGDCDHAEFPGFRSELRPISFFKDLNEDNSTVAEQREWATHCCPVTLKERCGLDRCATNADGTLEPTMLMAWVAKVSDATRDDDDVVAGLSKLTPEPLLLEAVLDEKTKKVKYKGADTAVAAGQTPFFRGRFRLARDNEAADLVVPAGDDISKPMWISYSELMRAKQGKVETTSTEYPDCAALEAAANSKAPAKAPSTKRLKIDSLETNCVPFLMPKACCDIP